MSKRERVSQGRSGRERKKARYVGIIQNRGKNPVKEDETGKDVYLCPPGNHEWATDPGYLGPVKGEEAHSQTGAYAKELVDGNVFGKDPAKEGKGGQGLEEVACGGVVRYKRKGNWR